MDGFLLSNAGEMFYYYSGQINENSIPLVCVHGGPGFTSYTMEPFLKLSEYFPVVCYDQAGCGRARRSGARRSLSIESFVLELESLREFLGVKKVHLLGHSFGALIIGEYVLTYPARVASTIFSSASIDIPRWMSDAQRLVSQMPVQQKEVLSAGLKSGQMDSPEFLKVLDVYYSKHVNGFSEMPECIKRSIEEGDALAYEKIWGQNELVVSGTIRDYDITPRLRQISCPTMFMCGRFDEATPESHQYFSTQVVGSKLHIFENSAHNTLLTEEAEVLRVVREFLIVG